MEIGITSENALNFNVVENAYSFMEPKPTIIGYPADSGVGEQPVNEQTSLGARNRIVDLRKRVVDLDRIISIENGIFQEKGQWVDRGVVVISVPSTGEEYFACSDGVVFPNEYVEKARELGFDKITVGRVMADEGFVLDAKDPHKCISGVSRQVYLQEAVGGLVHMVEIDQET